MECCAVSKTSTDENDSVMPVYSENIDVLKTVYSDDDATTSFQNISRLNCTLITVEK